MRHGLKKPRIHRITQSHHPNCLAELHEGEEGVLARINLPEEIARRLMELGFVPGSRVRAVHKAPGGDPRVFHVDGTQIALRRETALHLLLGPEPESGSGTGRL
ncbi:MAG: ferrous iron transport protein A [Acidobacteria bacterium]|nr:ferrous iron transport protein A [Acidobacteriota bacterium]